MLCYRRGNSFLHTISPLAKMVMLMGVTLLCILWESAVKQIALLFVLFLFSAYSNVFRTKQLVRMVQTFLPFSVPYFLFNSLAIPGKSVIWNGLCVQLTEEALIQSVVMTLRVMTLFVCSTLYIMTTDPNDLVRSLTQTLKVPYVIAYGCHIAFTFFPLLQQEAQMIWMAHQVRGGQKLIGIRNRVCFVFSCTTSIVASAIRRVQYLSAAMEARGFGTYEERTYLRSRQFCVHSKDWAILFLFIVLLLV